MTRVPVTIRLTHDEHDQLREAARQSGVTFSDLARQRLGVPSGSGHPLSDAFAAALDALDERVRQLEQLANRDY